MSFPVYLRLGPLTVHPHWIFESLAYTAGFYLYQRHRRQRGDVIDRRARWYVIAAAMLGGFAGSRVLSAFEDPFALAGHWAQAPFPIGGKADRRRNRARRLYRRGPCGLRDHQPRVSRRSG